jgi:NTE family protein
MPGDERTMLARVGRAALRAHTMTEDTRRKIIANRLPVHEWPERDLRITTVDAETGEFIVLTKAKGVDLVDAVAASSAAPLVYPPTTIAGRRYIDGGTRSAANADLAAGFDPVVVIAPFSLGIRRSQKLESQVAKLGASVKAIVVKPDEAARKAMGRQALDPAFRAPSARAGRTQGASVAKEVAGVWALAKN